MPGAFGAVHAASGSGNQLRVPLVEGRIFQDEQDVLLNPELEIADREQDALCLLLPRTPILSETSGESLFLLIRLEFCQQERMADADLLAVEGFDHHGRKLGQFQSSRDVCGRFAGAGGDLLDAVLRLVQVEECAEAAGLLHRMNIAPHQVLDQLGFQGFGVGEIDDADGNGGDFGHLRGAVTPRSGHNLKAEFIQWPH